MVGSKPRTGGAVEVGAAIGWAFDVFAAADGAVNVGAAGGRALDVDEAGGWAVAVGGGAGGKNSACPPRPAEFAFQLAEWPPLMPAIL